jgi:hypothetical protein
MRLRLATLCAAVFVSATTTAVLMSAIDVYAIGHVDGKWGGPWDNFWLGVTIYGIWAPLLTTPIVAGLGWSILRSHELRRSTLIAVGSVTGALSAVAWMLV